jgi:diguanylate cyclase (GGDEF)-like protein/PAS domain S-box-containing protein
MVNLPAVPRGEKEFNEQLRAEVRRLRRRLARIRRREAALRAEELTYRDIVDRANSIVLRWDPQGRIIFLNDYGQRLFGYSQAELVGRSVLGRIVADTESSGRDLVAMIEDLLRNPTKYLANENENMCRDGRRVWITWRNTPVVDAAGRLVEIISTGIDTTEHKRAEDALRASEERFRELAVRDNLTGLYNTRYLYEALARLIAASAEAGTTLSVIMTDLDRFKRVVDRYGHLNGSRVIQEVAATIRGSLEAPAFAVAYAGDEYVIVLPGAGNRAALETAEAIRARVAATIFLREAGHAIRLTASFGVATYPEDASDLGGLLSLADGRLFDVKRTGRNAVASLPRGERPPERRPDAPGAPTADRA